MRAIKIRSGGQAFIMDPGETCPAGEVCFFPGEWELALRMAKSAATDPSNSFWKDLLEKKRSLPGYTLFSEVAPDKSQEQAVIDFAPKPKPKEIQHEPPSDKAKGLSIAKQILADLAERAKKREGKNVAG